MHSQALLLLLLAPLTLARPFIGPLSPRADGTIYSVTIAQESDSSTLEGAEPIQTAWNPGLFGIISRNFGQGKHSAASSYDEELGNQIQTNVAMEGNNVLETITTSDWNDLTNKMIDVTGEEKVPESFQAEIHNDSDDYELGTFIFNIIPN